MRMYGDDAIPPGLNASRLGRDSNLGDTIHDEQLLSVRRLRDFPDPCARVGTNPRHPATRQSVVIRHSRRLIKDGAGAGEDLASFLLGEPFGARLDCLRYLYCDPFGRVTVDQEFGPCETEHSFDGRQVFRVDRLAGGKAISVPEVIAPFRNVPWCDALHVLMAQVHFKGLQLLRKVANRFVWLAVRTVVLFPTLEEVSNKD